MSKVSHITNAFLLAKILSTNFELTDDEKANLRQSFLNLSENELSEMVKEATNNEPNS